ncbi:MAG: dTDP-glucose 4,6-dehydratase [Myxococcales bacterium]|nr:dTDP-glucose 4,6-dehydratase [Myxococcales bacterium]
MRWVVTGGAGFIGSNFVRRALLEEWCDEIIVLDALTYAGNMENLKPVFEHPGFTFIHGNIIRADDVDKALRDGADAIFHFAAESHVDRSIESALPFVETNVVGTQNLIDAARKHKVGRFMHVSTDEVYGSLELEDQKRFSEESALEPTSPYAASKTSSDLLVLAAHKTYGLNTIVTRCSNNYGPYQFPEKFIPLFITNALENKPLPLYGDGKNVRDWIYVDEHSFGLKLAFEKGVNGEVYNLGGECERANKDIALAICEVTGVGKELIQPVEDRLAHDRRYAIEPFKAKDKLGFRAGPSIEERLVEVVDWYRDNKEWWANIKNGAYKDYYQRMYAQRTGAK